MDAQSPYRKPGAIGLLRAAVHVCDRRVGLHRIGVVLSVALIAIAVVVLYRILRDINLHEVVEALVTTSLAGHCARRAVRRRRLFHADVL